MALSFIMWAMYNFDGQNFIMAGKTIKSFQRNVLTPLKNILPGRKYTYTFKASDNLLTVSRGNRHNDFYIFGGKDDASQDLVQGMTAAGAYFDEVALMPESFVNQATGRCSVEGSKLWFNCNPEGPLHWFKTKWIDCAKDKGLLKLHFTMDDNLSLSQDIKDRYKSMYAGVFYLRYIKGLWAVAEGLIYSMFDDGNLYDDETRPVGMLATSTRIISCDYGTTNPCVFLDVRDDGTDIWIENEWGWDSRSEEARRLATPNKTDAEYADAMREFMTENAEWLRKQIRDDWTSYDGFCSFMSNDLDEWDRYLFEDMDERYISVMIGYMMYRANKEIRNGLVMYALEDVYAGSYVFLTDEGKEKMETAAEEYAKKHDPNQLTIPFDYGD